MVWAVPSGGGVLGLVRSVLAGADDRDRRRRDTRTPASSLSRTHVSAARGAKVTCPTVEPAGPKRSCGQRRCAEVNSGAGARGGAALLELGRNTDSPAPHSATSPELESRRPRHAHPAKCNTRIWRVRRQGEPGECRVRPAGRWSAAASLWALSPQRCLPPCGPSGHGRWVTRRRACRRLGRLRWLPR